MLSLRRQFGLERLSNKCCQFPDSVVNSSTLIENKSAWLEFEISRFPEKPGISKTRSNLTPQNIEFPETAWGKGFALGTKDKTELTAGLDWIRFQGTANWLQWRELVMTFPGRKEEFWVNTDASVKSYPTDPGFDNCMGGEYGSKLAWRRETTQDPETGKNFKTWHWAYTVTGKGCELLGELGIQRLLTVFARNDTAFPTRLDPFFEDYQGRLNPADIVNAVLSGNYTGFKKHNLQLSSSKGDGLDGFTATLGSRESERYRRIYHTGVKHGYNAMRFETETKGDWCKAVWAKIKPVILANQETLKEWDTDKHKDYLLEMANFWGKIAIAKIDFIDSSQKQDCNGSLVKCEKLDWWGKIVKLLGYTEVRIERETPSLDKTDRWLKRQVKAVLRTLHEGLGLTGFYDYIQGLVESCKQPSDKEKMNIAILLDKGVTALSEDTAQREEITIEIGKPREGENTIEETDPLFSAAFGV